MSFANEIKKREQGIETKKKYQDVEMRKGQLCSRKRHEITEVISFGGFIFKECLCCE